MAEQRKKQAPPQKAKTVRKVKKKRKTGRASQIGAILIVALAFYIVFTLFGAAIILYSFNSTAENPDIYSINILYDEKSLYELDSDEANNEYGLYIPFSYLSEISSFGLAGDGDSVTLFIIGSDNRIECTKNSSLIIINDNPLRISAPILFDDKANDYLIPVMLLENYINGIDIAYDNEKMVCNISSDLNKADISLKLLLPDDMEAAYFPESYKYYNTSEPETSE